MARVRAGSARKPWWTALPQAPLAFVHHTLSTASACMGAVLSVMALSHPFMPTMFPFADFPETTFTTLHQGCTVNEMQILPSDNYPRLKRVPQTELLSIPAIIKDIMALEPRQTSNKERFIQLCATFKRPSICTYSNTKPSV